MPVENVLIYEFRSIQKGENEYIEEMSIPTPLQGFINVKQMLPITINMPIDVVIYAVATGNECILKIAAEV